MTDVVAAYDVIRSRLEANQPAGLLAGYYWQNETGADLPDQPAPFAYTEFITDPQRLIGVGGGRGQNIYRNPGRIEIFVFVPRGNIGVRPAMVLGEELASLFRSYRDTVISCQAATVMPGGDGASYKPAGLQSEVGNYFFAFVEIDLTFDQVG